MTDNPLKDRVNIHYDRQWKGYSEKDVFSRVNNLGNIIDSITAHLPKRTHLDILDLGCGPAVIPLRLTQTNNEDIKMNIIGIDLSKAACGLGQAVVENNHIHNIHLLLADCESLPFRTKTFDCILSNATFNLLINKEKAFSQMAQVTKDGGIIIIGDCVAGETKGSCQTVCTDKWSQCIDGAPKVTEITKMARSNDLESIEIEDLTEIVLNLVKCGLWKWPEFLDSELRYKIFTFKK